MSILVENGFEIFTDISGKALEGGYIHVGEYGLNPLSNPVDAFWDKELTIPATDVRTKQGYPLNGTIVGRLYVADLYSIEARDKNGTQVYQNLYAGVTEGGIAWSAATTYAVNDIVSYGGLLYKSLLGSNTDQNPVTEITYWEVLSTGGGAGLPNYLEPDFNDWTIETGWTLTEETTSPINLENTINAEVADATAADVGFYQDIELNGIDNNSLLQLGFYFSDDSSMDFTMIDVEVTDEDDSSAVLWEGNLLDNSTYNSASGIYQFNALVSTNGNDNYRVRFKTNDTISGTQSMLLSNISLGAPFYYTAPSTGDLVGEIKTFPTYKDRTDLLPFAFDNAVSQTEYAELYAEIGDMYEAEHVAAGDDASGAGNFYPTPIPGAYNRVAYPDWTITESAFTNGAGVLNLTLDGLTQTRVRPGTAFRFVVESGTAPSNVPDGTIIYLNGGPATGVYLTEANAIANTGFLSYADSGSGIFRLTQEGISLDDAFQGHWHEAQYNGSPGVAYSFRTGAGLSGDVTDIIHDPVSDTVSGTPRTTNETRPTTYITFGYIRYRSVRSVELMASQTNREDVEEMYYSSQAPDATGKNRAGDLAFDTQYTVHSWADYPQLLANKTELIADGIFLTATMDAVNGVDPTGSTFVLKPIAPASGWRTVWVNTGSNPTVLANTWGLGKYIVSFGSSSVSVHDRFIVIGALGITTYTAHYMGPTINDKITITQDTGDSFHLYDSGAFASYHYLMKIQKLEEIGYAYLRTKSLSSVILGELTAQVARDDAGSMYYDYQAPASGLNRVGDIAFDGTTSHAWEDYPKLLAARTALTSADVFESDDGTDFVLKAITPSTGWNTLFEDFTNATDPLSFSVEPGYYRVYVGRQSVDIYQAHVYVEAGKTICASPWDVSANVAYNAVAGTWTTYSGVYFVQRIEKLEELGYAYMRTESLSTYIAATLSSDTFAEYTITGATDVTRALADFDTTKEYTICRNGSGAGVISFTGDIYWPDGTSSTDFELEGDGQITLFYAGGKWRVKHFTDSFDDGADKWIKGINGTLEVGSRTMPILSYGANEKKTITWTFPHVMNDTSYIADASVSPEITTDWYGVVSTRYDTASTTQISFYVRNGGTPQISSNGHYSATGRFRA